MKIKKEIIILIVGISLMTLRLIFNIEDGGFYTRMFFKNELNEAESYAIWNTIYQVLSIGILTAALYIIAKKKKI